MRVWLVTVGEPLPVDGSDKRLLRAGILAELLASQNHDVVWWSSAFNHVAKTHRFPENTVIDRSERYRLILLHSVGYRRNVSIRRVIDHWCIAREFSQLAGSQQRPDIILCSFPTIELSAAATRYGRKEGVPVVLDIRDLWPDVFSDLAPPWMRPLMRLLLAPLLSMTRRACKEATAIIGTTPSFVAWAVDRAGRRTTLWDRPFPMGYRSAEPAEGDRDAALRRWAARSIRADEFNICFFGTLGRQFELEPVIAAARLLERQHRPFRFILCGGGDRSDHYRGLAEGCGSVVFPGWVDSSDIWTLMRMSRVGLAPYPSRPNFSLNMPNKPIEYLSAGLPIVSSLRGDLEALLAAADCGVTYPNGDAAALADALIQLYDNPDRLAAMSRNALELYRHQFTSDRVYGDLISYLGDLVARESREPEQKG